MTARVVPVGCLFLAALAGACSDGSSTGPGAPLDASSAADSGSRPASSTADGGSQGARDSSAGSPDVGVVSVPDAGLVTDEGGAPVDAIGGGDGGTPADGGSTPPVEAGTLGPPGAVDISGTIVNKVWALIPGAQVCLQRSTTTCVTSGADGTFHIQGVGPLSLVVAATGYATAVYHPKSAAETGDWVLMAVPGENVALLFDGKTLDGWLQSSGTGLGNVPGTWDVQDAALHCVGTVRGTLVTKGDYGDYRLLFAVRQLPFTLGNNHYASALVWGARPPPNDALGALQFGVPNGYFWDYRPGKPGAGTAYFTGTSAGLSRTAWSQCEILTHVATGIARMACCTLTGAAPCKSVEVLRFSDATAGKTGPIAFQNHSPGGHDEFKDVTIEIAPSVNDLITNK